MRFSKAGVCLPHDFLQLPELAEESGVTVIDLLDLSIHHQGMNISLDIPDAVGQGTLLGAGNLLLLKTPVRKLDLVREQCAAGHDVNKPELSLDSSDALLSHRSIGVALNNLDAEKVVRITLKAFITVCRNFVLPVSLGDRCADIVGVKASISSDMVETDDTTILNVSGAYVIPGLRACEVRSRIVLGHDRKGLVLQNPDVVLVLVRVEGNLLLLATSRVHVAVRMEVTTLSVPMA